MLKQQILFKFRLQFEIKLNLLALMSFTMHLLTIQWYHLQGRSIGRTVPLYGASVRIVLNSRQFFAFAFAFLVKAKAKAEGKLHILYTNQLALGFPS